MINTSSQNPIRIIIRGFLFLNNSLAPSKICGTENGKFILSYKKVYLAHTWDELTKIKEADETISVIISHIVKGGLFE